MSLRGQGERSGPEGRPGPEEGPGPEERPASERRPQYRVREGNPETDAEAVLELWGEAFEGLRGEVGGRHLNWMYGENPGGPGSLFFLHSATGERIGFLGFGSREFRWRGQKLRAGIMVDFVVAKEHRSLGPALTLLKGGLKAGEEALGFLYGFPNRSAQGVFRRAGYRPVTTLRRFARPLRSGRFLKPRLPSLLATLLSPILDSIQHATSLLAFAASRFRYSWEGNAEIDEQFDELWARGEALRTITGNRSSRVLQWRFLEAPKGEEVEVVTAASRKTGSLEGYIIWKPGDSVAVIQDLFAPGDPGILHALLVFCARHARKRGCDSISMEFRGPAEMERAVRRAGFLPREEVQVYCVDGQAGLGDSEAEWYLTTFDRD